MKRALLSLLFLSLAGCAQNAVFELTVELPADSAVPAHYAHIQARANDSDFASDWAGTGDLAAFRLMPMAAMPQRVLVNIVTSDGAIIADPLSIKITFCVSPTCTDTADANPPQLRYIVARAFYIGHRTTYTVTIPTIPTDPAPMPTTVDKCSVGGCRDGTTMYFCTMMPTLRHFCE